MHKIIRGDIMKMGLWLFVGGLVLLSAIYFSKFNHPAATLSNPTSTLTEEVSLMQDYEGKVNAPDFPEGLEWLNTDKSLSLRDLRGKVVLLDFWTYCCINCIHIMPDLKKLEAKYKDELVVIGVHSAKFYGERESENIRQAILRYELEHPVVNDNQMIIWQQYAVRSWPTLILIDPTGKVIGSRSGEGIYEAFDEAIRRVIENFDKRGLIDRKPLKLKLEKERKQASVLNFPGKVLADEASNQLFIADSNHNRIVVLSLSDNSVKTVVGEGTRGMKDGTFEQATFNNPQGMAYNSQDRLLYVADTDNHAIRKVDFKANTVSTIAGTGEQTRSYPGMAGTGKKTALNSPWDLLIHEGKLYIAMAGSHQLWRMDLKSNYIAPHAGTGREALIDSTLDRAALAQPSGITTDGKRLYFADSEVSSIRAADISPRGKLETLVGGDLFEFGDVDGQGFEARLQHPLGVTYHEGSLYVADTYNNKIKRLNPNTKTIETFLGTGKEGMQDGNKPTFDEPGGLSVADGKLYIADTNNHVIRVADLKTKQVSTLQIKGLDKLMPKFVRAQTPVITLPLQSLEPGTATLNLRLNLPAGYKLNPNAPTRVQVNASNGTTVNEKSEIVQENPTFPLNLNLRLDGQKSSVQLLLTLYYCQVGKEGLCYVKEVRLEQPLEVQSGSGKRELTVEYTLEKP
jgi:DNA-binding beta-propeller fold protein YncE